MYLTAQLAALTASRQAESLLNREEDVSEVDKDAKEPEQNSRTQDLPLGATSQMSSARNVQHQRSFRRLLNRTY